MKIDYEAHEVFNPDYLNEHLGFVAGVLELIEHNRDSEQYEKSYTSWVLMEANNRVRGILEQLHEAVVKAMPLNKVGKEKDK